MEEMNQNTEEWLKHRCEGIGASDAPVIMGASFHKSIRELWEEKVHKKIDQNSDEYIFEKGHKLEAWARPGIEFETGLSWRPCLFEHKSFPFIRASLDGWQPEIMEVWECKFMGKEPWEQLANESFPIKERIPPEYFDQLMQQLFVTGAKAVRLTGVMEYKDEEYNTKMKKATTLRIERTPEFEEYINKTLAPKLFEFWKNVQEKTEPVAPKVESVVAQNPEFVELVKTYEGLSLQEKELKKQAKKESDRILGGISEKVQNAKTEIFNHGARVSKMDVEGIKLVEVAGKPIVDHEEALNSFFDWIKKVKAELSPGEIVDAIKAFPDEPSLEKYTTVGKPSLRITLPKPKKDEVKESHKPASGKVFDSNEQGPPIHETIKPEEKLSEWKNMTPEQQELQARSDAYTVPKTGKKPVKWASKSNAERIDYLKKAAKRYKDPSMLAFAEELMTLEKREEKVGGITFGE